MTKVSATKRLLFASLLFMILAVAAEGLILAGYRIAKGQWFPRERLRDQIRQLSGTETRQDPATLLSHPSASGEPDPFPNEILHPFAGYTLDLGWRQSAPEAVLMGVSLSHLSRGEEHLVVGLFGGSFANQIGVFVGPYLEETLRRATGRRIRIANLAVQGYKQPQQLMVLGYLLSLGAEFDLILNIDGFNEVALPPAELAPRGVFPFYPRFWFPRIVNFRTREELLILARMEGTRERRQRWAGFFPGPLNRPHTLLLIWKVGDRILERREFELRRNLDGLAIQHETWEARGPDFSYSDSLHLNEVLAHQWARSSTLMRVLSEAHGARYFHFLQPNQYLPGSKPMGPEERSIALSPDHPYGAAVVEGYPVFRREGSRLKDSGVNFHDLTQVFADNDETLYDDNCCHLNRRGYELIVAEIVDRIDDAGPPGVLLRKASRASGGPLGR
jgi:hypothetical protein